MPVRHCILGRQSVTDVEIAKVDHFGSESDIPKMAVFRLDDVDVSACSIVFLILQYDFIDHAASVG